MLRHAVQVLTGEVDRLTLVLADRDTLLQHWKREAEQATTLAQVRAKPLRGRLSGCHGVCMHCAPAVPCQQLEQLHSSMVFSQCARQHAMCIGSYGRGGYPVMASAGLRSGARWLQLRPLGRPRPTMCSRMV
jgi:hypothetical protein